MREERSRKSEEGVENFPQGFKNEWKINGCRVLVSTQIPQFWDIGLLWSLKAEMCVLAYGQRILTIHAYLLY